MAASPAAPLPRGGALTPSVLDALENAGEFIARHIGIEPADEHRMLAAIAGSANTLTRSQLVGRIVPESIARVQEDASRSLADSIRTTASQSAKAMEEVMRPAVAQLAAIGETAKNAVTEAASMQKQSREQHAEGQRAFIENSARVQRDLAKSLEDTVRPAAQQLAALGDAVKNTLGQLSQLERTSREQQAAAQQASLEVSRQMQRDATKSLEDNLRPVAQQLSALGESIRAVTGQLGGLDRAAADAQATVARSVESNMSRVQQDVARASSEAMQTANTQLATLQQGINR